MPRSLSFGNGSTLVLLDRFARVRDIFFPYVGLENHVGGRLAHRIGIWVDGQFSWLDDGTWKFDILCDDSYSGRTKAASDVIGITVEFTDALHNEKNIFLRRLHVHNTREKAREVRVFFNQQFDIYHAEKGDTAFYDPATHSIIHYEGKRVFLINARHGTKGFDDWTTGVFQLEGKEGTYRDAEDGTLAKNPIEHGLVDSTIGLAMTVVSERPETVHYWFTVGEFIDEAKNLNAVVMEQSPDYLIKSASGFWGGWSERMPRRYYGLGERAVDLFRKSQFYLRSHVDKRGAIIASGDSDMLQGGRDTYAYMWHRDAAFSAVALDWLGDRHGARKFFELATELIEGEGYLMHKYRPDKSLGSSWHGWMVGGHPELPIQEDETALVLWALWEHWLASRDLDFIESIYDPFIRKAASFLVDYRDPHSGFPKQSYNLWEERFGLHTFTAASVYGALAAASRFALMLGKSRAAHRYGEVAEEVRTAIVKHLYNLENGTFYRSIYNDPAGITAYDRTIDASSAYGVFLFGVLPADDEMLVRAMAVTEEALTVRTPVGGIARYAGDDYCRASRDMPGNPWVLTTLWFAEYAIARAKTDKDLDRARAILEWAVRVATPSGILPEQVDPYTRAPVNAAPLTWSHAEYIRTVILYLRKVEELSLPRTDVGTSGGGIHDRSGMMAGPTPGIPSNF